MIGWIHVTMDGELVCDNNGLLYVYPSKERAVLNKQHPEYLVIPITIQIESEIALLKNSGDADE